MEWQRQEKKQIIVFFFLAFVFLLSSSCGKSSDIGSANVAQPEEIRSPSFVSFDPVTRVANNYLTMSFNLSNSSVYPDGSAWVQSALPITSLLSTMQVASAKSFDLSLNSLTDLTANVYTPAVPTDPMVLSVNSSGTTTSGASTMKKYTSGSLVSYFGAVATSAYNVRVVQSPELTTVSSIYPLTTVVLDSDSSHSTSHIHHAATISAVQVDTTAKTLTASGNYFVTANEGAFGNCRYYKNKAIPATWDDVQTLYDLAVNSSTVFNCNANVTRNTSAQTWSLNLNITGLSGVNLIVLIADDCWSASGSNSDNCGWTFFNLPSAF